MGVMCRWSGVVGCRWGCVVGCRWGGVVRCRWGSLHGSCTWATVHLPIFGRSYLNFELILTVYMMYSICIGVYICIFVRVVVCRRVHIDGCEWAGRV